MEQSFFSGFVKNSYKKDTKITITVLQDYNALGKQIIFSVLKAIGYDHIDLCQKLSVGYE